MPDADHRPNRPLSARWLDLEVGDREVVPRYLVTPTDRAMVDRALAWLSENEGTRRADIEAHVLDACPSQARRLSWLALMKMLQGLCGFVVPSPIQPALLREAVFEAAAQVDRSRDAVLGDVAERFSLSVTDLERWLYADIMPERCLGALPAGLTAEEAARRYNLAQAQGLLQRSEWARIRAGAQLAPVLRHARRQRLICNVDRGTAAARPKEDGDWQIVVSGPLSLFHHTTIYGRAMAGWLPVLARAPGWTLEASCRLRDIGPRRFRADHTGPISAVESQPLRPFDSALETHFARDMAREVGDRFHVLREADPYQVDGQVVCPDFTLIERETDLRVAVELVGFWTPEYLTRKLALLRQVSPGWVICVDESLAAGREGQLPPGPLFRFRRRVPVRAFVSFLERTVLRRGS